MFAVIYIPDFFLQAQLRDPHDTKPTALVKTAKKSNDSKARIMALNQAARDLQVETGMTAAQGQARCGELRILHPSEEAEAEAQRILLELSVSCSRLQHGGEKGGMVGGGAERGGIFKGALF